MFLDFRVRKEATLKAVAKFDYLAAYASVLLFLEINEAAIGIGE